MENKNNQKGKKHNIPIGDFDSDHHSDELRKNFKKQR